MPGNLPDSTASGLPPTALWTASALAAESRREGRALDDPWAAEFLAAARFAGGPPGEGAMQQVLPDWVVVRSLFFDERLLSAVRSGCRQVVLLGAGLDSRAYRLEWPAGVEVFEVDHPAVLDFKERVLDGRRPRRARRTAVRADPAALSAGTLRSAGLDPQRPTAWLCENLLYSLEPGTVEAIAAVMGELSAPGSTFAAECVNADATGSDLVAPFLDDLASLGMGWHWRLTDPVGWWGERGWAAHVADPLSLPYAVQRFAAHLPMLGEAAARCVFLTSGTRS